MVTIHMSSRLWGHFSSLVSVVCSQCVGFCAWTVGIPKELKTEQANGFLGIKTSWAQKAILGVKHWTCVISFNLKDTPTCRCHLHFGMLASEVMYVEFMVPGS